MKKVFKRSKISLDFGTANCSIIKDDEGVCLFEPTVVAIDRKTKRIVSIGTEAKELLGKENQDIFVRRPLRNGGISNSQLAKSLLDSFFDKVLGKYRVLMPDVTVSVPSKINSIEERALVKSLERVGVNKITLYPESMAAATGAGLNVEDARGSMIINLGGGTAEIAIITAGGIVTSVSHIGSGDQLNNAIAEHVKKEFNLVIGEALSEKIKIEIADALKTNNAIKFEISGKHNLTGEPMVIDIDSNTILPAVRSVLEKILSSIKHVIQSAPSDLVPDLIEDGIAISGGGAMLRNIDVFLTKSLGIPCYVVDDPINCVVRGLRQYS